MRSRSTDAFTAPSPDRREGAGEADAYIAVARVLAAHGIHGELRCEVITDFPERFRHTRRLYAGQEHLPLELERARLDRRGVVIKVAGLESRTEAEALRGKILFVPEAEAVRLPRGTYFWHEIIGLRVCSTAGEELGTIHDILQTGSNDVYVVKNGDRELLVPAIRDVVREIDLAAGVVKIELMEGLG